MSEKDFVECVSGIILIFGLFCILCLWVNGDFDSDYEPFNTTEHIIDMKITYIDNLGDRGNHYFIFTENYCYDIPLSEYSKLHKGDIVNITIYEYSSSLLLGNNSYGDV